MTRRLRVLLVAAPFLLTPCCVGLFLPATQVFTLGPEHDWRVVARRPGQFAPTPAQLWGRPRQANRADSSGRALFVRYEPEWLKLGIWAAVAFAFWAALALGISVYVRRPETSRHPPTW